MGTNQLQILYNDLEKQFLQCEQDFLAAEKARHEQKNGLTAVLRILEDAQKQLDRYPQAATRKRIHLMETLVRDSLLRHDIDLRNYNALGFLLQRLQANLASEMLEPKLYGKIRAALEHEAGVKELRLKYPDVTGNGDETQNSNPGIQHIKPMLTTRLMLISAQNINYAIPITRILKKLPVKSTAPRVLEARGYRLFPLPINRSSTEDYKIAVAFSDLKGDRRILYADEYFTPVELRRKLLRKYVTFSASRAGTATEHRAQVRFYGRQFFVYGARISYTVRTGGRINSPKP
jgi:hypothetical protein